MHIVPHSKHLCVVLVCLCNHLLRVFFRFEAVRSHISDSHMSPTGLNYRVRTLGHPQTAKKTLLILNYAPTKFVDGFIQASIFSLNTTTIRKQHIASNFKINVRFFVRWCYRCMRTLLAYIIFSMFNLFLNIIYLCFFFVCKLRISIYKWLQVKFSKYVLNIYFLFKYLAKSAIQ